MENDVKGICQDQQKIIGKTEEHEKMEQNNASQKAQTYLLRLTYLDLLTQTYLLRLTY